MLQAFKAYIQRENLFQSDEIILLAVSGGIDSIVMAELFSMARLPFAVAHVNFQLRGEDSDKDEAFVSSLAKRYKVRFFTKRFFTTDYADLHGLSIQMAARELRYGWFNELIDKEGFHAVATAHHLDDQIETFFINMLRSTGIAGFHGILPKQGKIIRPLLFASRQEIAEFAGENRLKFREDASNREVKYLRNKIRHELLPVIAEINSGYRSILTENIHRIRDAETIYRNKIEEAGKKILRKRKGAVHISIDKLKELTPLTTYLYEFLSPFGFNYSVVKDIVNVLDDDPGKQFFSPTHRLIKDRDFLIITPIPGKSRKPGHNRIFTIKGPGSGLTTPVRLRCSKKPVDKDFRIDPDPAVAQLDLRRITFPLVLRKWKHGDSFFPFGKNQKKKLSDFFTDQKFSLDEKEETWILCSGDKIVWVVGHRIDNRFRVTPKTREVLIIKWKK